MSVVDEKLKIAIATAVALFEHNKTTNSDDEQATANKIAEVKAEIDALNKNKTKEKEKEDKATELFTTIKTIMVEAETEFNNISTNIKNLMGDIDTKIANLQKLLLDEQSKIKKVNS